MRLELTHRFAIPLRDGFDYIVEPRNWPEYCTALGAAALRLGAWQDLNRAIKRAG